RAGGWAERICVPAVWIVPIPNGFTTREAMLYGTAGFTAGLSLLALQSHGIMPERGPVLVTGASGGVGSIAVRLLARQQYEVVAITGKQAMRATLLDWGAQEVLGRDALGEATSKPLLPARWASVIDCVGGTMLATAIKQTSPGGCVAACGLTGGVELPLTVFPFILRGVTLAGIDSVWCDAARRQQVWNHFANDWRLPNLDAQVTTVSLDEVGTYVPKILQGEVAGRVIVAPRG
ncbi:MAG TPA: zinc-binding dehydrogenase, partial [Pirellulaceae bacterium]|nr:zinc-binding dehydrogenase [Pirellulaceae bacterium]